MHGESHPGGWINRKHAGDSVKGYLSFHNGADVTIPSLSATRVSLEE